MFETTTIGEAPDGSAVVGLDPKVERGGQFALQIDAATWAALKALPRDIRPRLVEAVEDDEDHTFPDWLAVRGVISEAPPRWALPVELRVVLARRSHPNEPVEVGETVQGHWFRTSRDAHDLGGTSTKRPM
jgi:hypothetical protein